MNTEILQRFNLTFEELKEYARLKKEIFGNRSITQSLFVVLDDNNTDHKRYKELAGKVIHLNAYLVNNLKGIS